VDDNSQSGHRDSVQCTWFVEVWQNDKIANRFAVVLSSNPEFAYVLAVSPTLTDLTAYIPNAIAAMKPAT
jgi:hypothetical protein